MDEVIGIAAIKEERDRWATAQEIAERGGNREHAHLCFTVQNRLTWVLAKLGAESWAESQTAVEAAKKRASDPL